MLPGPGFLNSTAALARAYACNTPVLSIIGQAPSQQAGLSFGAHHEITDQLGILRNLTKCAIHVEHPALVPAAMEKAFRLLNSGRRRPVGLEMAPDITAMTAEVALSKTVKVSAPRPGSVIFNLPLTYINSIILLYVRHITGFESG